MGSLSILTLRQHDSHPVATTGMTVCKPAAAELTPHKLTPSILQFHLFHNYYVYFSTDEHNL